MYKKIDLLVQVAEVTVSVNNRQKMRRKNSKVEALATDVLLEKPREVKIGTETYKVAPPTLATLMEVSGIISRLGDLDNQGDDVAGVAFRRASDAPLVCEAVSVLVYGAERPKKERSWLDGIITRLKEKVGYKRKIDAIYPNRREELAEKLLYEAKPSELLRLLTELLEGMELGAFFGLTTFLRELNVAKPTKKVV